MITLDLVLQFGRFISNGDSESNINWVDIVFRFITVSVAITIPLFVFYIKNKIDKKNEEKKQANEEKEELNYFFAVIKSIIDGSDIQVSAYSDYINKLKSEPLIQHKLMLINPQNLNRIVNKYDQQKVYRAFRNRIYAAKSDADSLNVNYLFMKLYEALDIYLDLYNQSIVINNEHHDFIIQSRTQYISLAKEKILPAIDLLIHFLKITNKGASTRLEEIKKDFYDTATSIIPFSVLQNVINKILLELESDLKLSDLGVKMLSECRNASSIYDSVVKQSNQLAKEIEETYIEVGENNKIIKSTIREIYPLADK